MESRHKPRVLTRGYDKATITAGSKAEATRLFDAALLRGEYDDELQQAFDPRQHQGLTTDWTEIED